MGCAVFGFMPLAYEGLSGLGVEMSRTWMTLDVEFLPLAAGAGDGEMGGDGVSSPGIGGNGKGGGMVPGSVVCVVVAAASCLD